MQVEGAVNPISAFWLTIGVICVCLYVMTQNSNTTSTIRQGVQTITPTSPRCWLRSMLTFLRVLRDYPSRLAVPTPSKSVQGSSSGVCHDKGVALKLMVVMPYFGWLIFTIMHYVPPLLGHQVLNYSMPSLSHGSICLSFTDMFSDPLRIIFHPLWISSDSRLYWLVWCPFLLYAVGVLVSRIFESDYQSICCFLLSIAISSFIGSFLIQKIAPQLECTSGLNPAIFSLCVFTFLANPVIRTEAFADPDLQLPFAVQLRWPLSVLFFVAYLFTDNTQKFEIDQVTASITGILLGMLHWSRFNLGARLGKSLSDGTHIHVTFWTFILFVCVCFAPFSMEVFPPVFSWLSINWTSLSELNNVFRPGMSLSEIVSHSPGVLSQLAPRLFKFYGLLVPLTRQATLTYLQTAIVMLLYILAMATRFWAYPCIGFVGAVVAAYQLLKVV